MTIEEKADIYRDEAYRSGLILTPRGVFLDGARAQQEIFEESRERRYNFFKERLVNQVLNWLNENPRGLLTMEQYQENFKRWMEE